MGNTVFRINNNKSVKNDNKKNKIDDIDEKSERHQRKTENGLGQAVRVKTRENESKKKIWVSLKPF